MEPSSPRSEYSLDLNALDLDARSDLSDGLPRQQIDRIHSEDIDGPSDFTQNMEMWMRGGPAKGEAAAASLDNGTVLVSDATPKTSLQDAVAAPLSLEPSEQERSEARLSETTIKHDLTGKDQHLPIVDESPEDQFSSEWYPNGQSSTPGPATLNKLLQPTVEDYHSELVMQTPAQTRRASRVPSRQATPSLLRHQTSPEEVRQNVRGESRLPESPTAEALREQREAKLLAEHVSALGERERRIAVLQAQLLRAEADALRDRNASQVAADNILRREADHARTVNALQAQVETYRTEMNEQRDAHESAVARLRSRIQELEGEVESQQVQLSDAQRAHDDAQEVLSGKQLELNDILVERDAVQDVVVSKQVELNEAILERDAAQDQLKSSQVEVETLRAELADVSSVNAAVDAELTETMRRRDQRWREKLEASERERRLMAQVLMHEWGRRDLGTSQPQRYQYVEAEREGT